jgi:hypothetical protein
MWLQHKSKAAAAGRGKRGGGRRERRERRTTSWKDSSVWLLPWYQRAAPQPGANQAPKTTARTMPTVTGVQFRLVLLTG